MGFKLIASDLDETLLGKSRKVHPDNIKAIQKARELGVHFVPATGRGFTTVGNTLKELGLYDAEDEYVISFNGGAITENKDNRLLSFKGMSFDLVSDIFQRGLDLDVVLRIYTKDSIYVYHIDEAERAFSSNRAKIIECDGEDISALKDEEFVKFVYVNSDYSYLNQIVDTKLNDLKDVLDISYSSNRYLELNPKGVNKGFGLKTLADLLHIDIKDTIAVGDNYNDLPMIQAAGLGIGVQNTVEEMKPMCDYITNATCEEPVFKEIIEKFIL